MVFLHRAPPNGWGQAIVWKFTLPTGNSSIHQMDLKVVMHYLTLCVCVCLCVCTRMTVWALWPGLVLPVGLQLLWKQHTLTSPDCLQVCTQNILKCFIAHSNILTIRIKKPITLQLYISIYQYTCTCIWDLVIGICKFPDTPMLMSPYCVCVCCSPVSRFTGG